MALATLFRVLVRDDGWYTGRQLADGRYELGMTGRVVDAAQISRFETVENGGRGAGRTLRSPPPAARQGGGVRSRT